MGHEAFGGMSIQITKHHKKTITKNHKTAFEMPIWDISKLDD
jgi:hypothetical protein